MAQRLKSHASHGNLGYRLPDGMGPVVQNIAKDAVQLLHDFKHGNGGSDIPEAELEKAKAAVSAIVRDATKRKVVVFLPIENAKEDIFNHGDKHKATLRKSTVALDYDLKHYYQETLSALSIVQAALEKTDSGTSEERKEAMVIAAACKTAEEIIKCRGVTLTQELTKGDYNPGEFATLQSYTASQVTLAKSVIAPLMKKALESPDPLKVLRYIIANPATLQHSEEGHAAPFESPISDSLLRIIVKSIELVCPAIEHIPQQHGTVCSL